VPKIVALTIPLGNVQRSYDASGKEEGFTQAVQVPSYGEGLAKSLYNFHNG